MKGILGFLFFMLFIAGFAFVFLKGKQVDSQPTAASELPFRDIDWRPLSIGDADVADNPELFLRFEADGKISGHGGCNRFFGSWEFDETGIRAGPLGSTRMACPEPVMSLETRFMQALEKTTQIRVAGDRLRLLDASNVALAVLVHADASGA